MSEQSKKHHEQREKEERERSKEHHSSSRKSSHKQQHAPRGGLLTFAIIHIYMVVRADIFGKSSSVSAMISGWRMFRE